MAPNEKSQSDLILGAPDLWCGEGVGEGPGEGVWTLRKARKLAGEDRGGTLRGSPISHVNFFKRICCVSLPLIYDNVTCLFF